MVFARVSFSSPLPVAVARTSQSPFPLYAMLKSQFFNQKFVNIVNFVDFSLI